MVSRRKAGGFLDPIRAERMKCELIGNRIDGWQLDDYLGAGKSALVMSGTRDAQRAAIKIFDPEIVARHKKEKQLERIKRECSLIHCQNENLIKILGGGECPQSGYLYVAMEQIDAKNLHDQIKLIPRGKIPNLIHQIAGAAKYLESLGLAHRDIKPENIVVFPDFDRAILLDLGVVHPIGDGRLTDEEGKPFLGTLMYSPPELLIREEDDSIDGWRAVTFYQLGAVLHDMIMKKTIFKEFSEPYGLLAKAVREQRPEIRADDVSPDLIILAQNCLVKDPSARLKLVNWESFNNLEIKGALRSSENARDRVIRRSMQAKMDAPISVTEIDRSQLKRRVLNRVEQLIRHRLPNDRTLPPKVIRKIDNAIIGVEVLFQKSVEQHGLNHALHIIFYSDLIDTETMSIIVKVSAWLYNDRSIASTTGGIVVYSGPLESQKLVDTIDSYLWGSIEIAQTLGIVTFGESYPLDLSKINERNEQ